MTRGRDVFWGVLAAVLPLVSVMVFGNIERRPEQYMARTFNQMAAYPVFALMFILMGVALFALAVRFGSKPVEISRIPLIGLFIGWIILTVVGIWHERGIHVREEFQKQNLIFRWVVLLVALFSIIIFGIYGPGYDASSFIYKQF